jgi:hypothetical protein
VTVRRTGERHRNSNGRTNGKRENRGPNREEQRSGPSAGTASDSERQVDPGAHQRAENGQSDGRQGAEGPMDTMGARTDNQQIEELSDAKHGAQDSAVAQRKAKNDANHRWRTKKRAREEVNNTAAIGRYGIQRELHPIVGDGTSALLTPALCRGLLGRTDRIREQ